MCAVVFFLSQKQYTLTFVCDTSLFRYRTRNEAPRTDPSEFCLIPEGYNGWKNDTSHLIVLHSYIRPDIRTSDKDSRLLQKNDRMERFCIVDVMVVNGQSIVHRDYAAALLYYQVPSKKRVFVPLLYSVCQNGIGTLSDLQQLLLFFKLKGTEITVEIQPVFF